MKPAWQRGPIEDAGSQTIAKFDHMSSKPRHVWQGWFLSHEKIKFIFMDHPELCISNCKLEVVKAPEPAKLHKLVWRRKTTERPSFLRLTRCQFNAPAKWYAAKWHNICVKWWCDVMLRDVMVSEVRWCDAMWWDVGPWGGQMPLFPLNSGPKDVVTTIGNWEICRSVNRRSVRLNIWKRWSATTWHKNLHCPIRRTFFDPRNINPSGQRAC